MNLQNSNNAFKIQKALIDDAQEVSELIIKSIDFFHAKNYTNEELAIWKRGYSTSDLKNKIANKLSYILKVNNRIAGFIQFDNTEIKGFYVKPKFIGKGFGRILLQYMLTEIKIRGYYSIQLTSNKWTVGFYEKNGFKLIGKEIVYWENHPFSEYRMIKDLTL
jgi:GNAT superfamily N-acetyltransferase